MSRRNGVNPAALVIKPIHNYHSNAPVMNAYEVMNYGQTFGLSGTWTLVQGKLAYAYHSIGWYIPT